MKKFLFLLALNYVCCNGQNNDSLKNYNTPLKDLLENGNIHSTQISINIDKSEFILSIVVDSAIIKQYPIVFGGNPKDDKRMEGDQCTPEGTFKVRAKYPHKSWSKFIWIDYPNAASWKKFNAAKHNKEIPENAKIGGSIGIHGVPDGMDFLIDTRMNWTLGCISLKNKDINDFYPFINKDIRVKISK